MYLTEKQWAYVLLALVLILAAYQRFLHVGFGLPFLFHPDERIATAQVSKFFSGLYYLYLYHHPPLIKMLAASDPGVVRLLPACPAAWTSGTIEGVLCRGQIEITRLTWNGKTIEAGLKSARAQEISLFAPGDIKTFAVKKGRASVRTAGEAGARRLSLPAGEDVLIELELK